MSKQSVHLAIIFVLYQGYDEFESFLGGQGPLPSALRLIVMDNTPHSRLDRDRLMRWEDQYGVTTGISVPENLGYFGAANYAMTLFPELYDYEYVAISNTDVSFSAAQVLHTLSALAPSHSGVGAIAPRLTHHDGRPKAQLHYIEKPARAQYARLARIFSNYYLGFLHRIAGDLKRALRASRDEGSAPRRLFAPHGAFMIMSRAYFAKTGGFAHVSFLFNEEIYVGRECEKAGLACVFEPNITYSHRNHGVVGLIPSRRLISYICEAHNAVLPILD